MDAYYDAEDRRVQAAEAARDLQIALLTTPPASMAGVIAVLRHAMTGQYGEVCFDGGNASTVLGDLYMTGNDELIEIAQNFLPMFADTITRLASTTS